jgi:hypothetical protein
MGKAKKEVAVVPEVVSGDAVVTTNTAVDANDPRTRSDR